MKFNKTSVMPHQPTHRYPGIHPFRQEEESLFFGRSEESRQLFDMICVEKLVVLFGKSGIGKTSLLNAGMAAFLAQSNFIPVFVRFNDPAYSPEEHFRSQFLETAARLANLPEQENTNGTLWELIKSVPLSSNGTSPVPVFVLDQFEELFTRYEAPARQNFVRQLADLVSGDLPEEVQTTLMRRIEAGAISPEEAIHLEKPPSLKVILSIRWDMLSFLDEISGQIPSILRARYSLRPLSPAQAREAMVEPARKQGGQFLAAPFEWSPAALQAILNSLAQNDEVESFQLQVVCRAIEDKFVQAKIDAKLTADAYTSPLLSPDVNDDEFDSDRLAAAAQRIFMVDKPMVTPGFFGGESGIREILRNFYLNQVAKLPAEDQLPARRLIEDELLTDQGRRRSVDEETLLELPGIEKSLLDALENSRLLRKEPRLGTFYYEISHDTLVEPVKSFRKKRLEEAERQRRELELEDLRRREEEALREAAEERRRKEELEKALREVQRQRQRARMLVVTVAIAFALAMVGLVLAREQRRKAIQQQEITTQTLEKFLVEKAAKEKVQVNELLGKADSFIQADEWDLALKQLRAAAAIDPTNQEVKEKIRFCEQQKE